MISSMTVTKNNDANGRKVYALLIEDAKRMDTKASITHSDSNDVQELAQIERRAISFKHTGKFV